MKLYAFALTLLSAATAAAQPGTTTSPPQPEPPTAPTPPDVPDPSQMQPAAPQPPAPPTQNGVPMSTLDPNAAPPVDQPTEEKKSKEPKAGDFNAGGQARFPSGPDEMGNFASFNWVAADLKGRYYVFKTVTLDANIPIAIIKPDTVGPMGPEPAMFGGFTATLDARMQAPKMPGIKYDTDVGAALTFGYMRQGAMLLSDKDYPLFLGDMQPGFSGGLIMKIKLSSVVDFSFIPSWVFQKGEPDSLTAVQIPLSLAIKVGSLVKVSADLGIYTGDDYSFSAENGGRITAGGALDLKIGKILIHGGIGVASLITDSMGPYPTISDSFYVEANVKYAK